MGLALSPSHPRTFQVVDSVWRAPLFLPALAYTSGIVLDHYLHVPVALSLVLAVASVLACGSALFGRRQHDGPQLGGLPIVFIGLCSAALGSAYHHWHREIYAANDIGEFASPDPVLSQIRGVLEDEPAVIWQPAQTPLESRSRGDPTVATLRVTQFHREADWIDVSGRARLIIQGQLVGLHAGDEIEAIGRLQAPHGASNPGEEDYASKLRDQRIRALFLVRGTPDAVTRLAAGLSVAGALARVRGWGQRTLQQYLPAEQSGMAMALLLGEGSTLTSADWERYIRTGVVHVLIIAGQHLVVLAAFLWCLVRLFGFRRSRAAGFVAILLLCYALLTGGRPPVLRASIMVCMYCGSLLLLRRNMMPNAFALAWLVVTLLNPANVLDGGCQLSFLSVTILYWGVGRWMPTGFGFQGPQDPLDQLVESSRPAWQRYSRRAIAIVVLNYTITAIVWLSVAPLVATRYHVLSFHGLLIGPPVVFLACVGMLFAFLLLLSAAACWPLVPVFAKLAAWTLAAAEWLVTHADSVKWGRVYVGNLSDWWLWIFYSAFLALLLFQPMRVLWRWAVPTGIGWICIGLLSGASVHTSDELRCTFLAVGHGGCTVLETPDGRTLLYDAGAITGSDVTRRQIAPYLWSRGIRRIDEVFLSHADLDHFNGLPALEERFSIGQVTCTPTFQEKPTGGVQLTLESLRQHGIAVRIVSAGERLSADEVAMEVLHPPPMGPDGNENARSLVLLVRHAGHSILLTGDLEGPGLQRVLSLPAPRVDVLMAPHHGSRVANTPELAAWARPRVVVSCEGPPRGQSRAAEPYSTAGAPFFGTWPHGAVTLRSHASGLILETFHDHQKFVVRRGGAPN
jgi:competence protein ComEC